MKPPKKSGVNLADSLIFSENSHTFPISANPIRRTVNPKMPAARHRLRVSKPTKIRAGYTLIQAARLTQTPATRSCVSEYLRKAHVVSSRKNRTNTFQLPLSISHKVG